MIVVHVSIEGLSPWNWRNVVVVLTSLLNVFAPCFTAAKDGSGSTDSEGSEFERFYERGKSIFIALWRRAVHQLGLGFCFPWCPLIMLNVCCICWFSFFPLGLRCCSLLLIIGFKHVRILIKVLVMILKFYTFVLHASLWMTWRSWAIRNGTIHFWTNSVPRVDSWTYETALYWTRTNLCRVFGKDLSHPLSPIPDHLIGECRDWA